MVASDKQEYWEEFSEEFGRIRREDKTEDVSEEGVFREIFPEVGGIIDGITSFSSGVTEFVDKVLGKSKQHEISLRTTAIKEGESGDKASQKLKDDMDEAYTLEEDRLDAEIENAKEDIQQKMFDLKYIEGQKIKLRKAKEREDKRKRGEGKDEDDTTDSEPEPHFVDPKMKALEKEFYGSSLTNDVQDGRKEWKDRHGTLWALHPERQSRVNLADEKEYESIDIKGGTADVDMPRHIFSLDPLRAYQILDEDLVLEEKPDEARRLLNEGHDPRIRQGEILERLRRRSGDPLDRLGGKPFPKLHEVADYNKAARKMGRELEEQIAKEGPLFWRNKFLQLDGSYFETTRVSRFRYNFITKTTNI